ncbi:MAG TPA: ribonuclease H-like domain-containing protein [Bryobacteraceae bacterium]|nr:ribonuclease H-like domain-containing protein [Bryobacteraceae bacterium]
MSAIQEQLALLREKVARIDQKYAAAEKPRVAPCLIEEIVSGQVVETAFGAHFETERLYERHRRHGSVGIADLADLPENALLALSEGAIPRAHPTRWAFLDTETTGLAGGTGTYAFLIGVGSIDQSGFRVRQFFMRDYGEEASLLASLSDYLAQFEVLVTYNGKAYDQPLLETRYRMVRSRPPFARLQHLDLLYGARRLWKLRLDRCRLVDLEHQILGVERQGDLPGEMIPYYYFEYLRMRQAFRLVPIFHHNMMDIVSLACLTAIVPLAFGEPGGASLRHGADLIGLARWLVAAGRYEEALALYRRAVDLGLPDDLLFRALAETGAIEKRLGREAAALEIFTDLTASPNPYRAHAYLELAKYYEHRERNYALALEMTVSAREIEEAPEIQQREERLRRRIARPPAKTAKKRNARR